jgi:hypothetical protein
VRERALHGRPEDERAPLSLIVHSPVLPNRVFSTPSLTCPVVLRPRLASDELGRGARNRHVAALVQGRGR